MGVPLEEIKDLVKLAEQASSLVKQMPSVNEISSWPDIKSGDDKELVTALICARDTLTVIIPEITSRRSALIDTRIKIENNGHK